MSCCHLFAWIICTLLCFLWIEFFGIKADCSFVILYLGQIMINSWHWINILLKYFLLLERKPKSVRLRLHVPINVTHFILYVNERKLSVFTIVFFCCIIFYSFFLQLFTLLSWQGLPWQKVSCLNKSWKLN